MEYDNEHSLAWNAIRGVDITEEGKEEESDETQQLQEHRSGDD